MSKLTAWMVGAVIVLAAILAAIIVAVARDSSDGPAAVAPAPSTPTAPAMVTQQAPQAAPSVQPNVPEPAPQPPTNGGRSPSGATEITGIGTGSDLQQKRRMIQSPTGTIKCDIWENRPDRMKCSVEQGSRMSTQVDFSTSVEMRTIDLGDPKTRPTAPGNPQPVGYGQTVYYGSFYCSSAEDGMTCWNSTTGAGAFMSRGRVDQITR